jgi:ankyrin repeat protein
MPHTHNHSNCNCKSSSLSQTLDEIDFTRSIHYSCLNNQLAQVQSKLSKNPQLVNSKDNYGYTPLVRLIYHKYNIILNNFYTKHYAAKKGNLDICKYLVENGACVHQITNGQGTTVIFTKLTQFFR